MRGKRRRPFRSSPTLCYFLAVAFLSASRIAISAEQPAGSDVPSPQASKREQTGVREFAPGVRIHWRTVSVELESRVVLREGSLELLACSPQTREHESILAVSARPLHIFQAMGLIGLEAGSPARYDEKLERWFPASGEPLDLRIAWREDGNDRAVAAAEWMVERKTGKPPEPLRWVLAGSVAREEGGFGADADGTVACVVDFDSALIALSTRHSADDAELWLAANTKEVPPIGTRCTMTVRSAYNPKVEVEIATGGAPRTAEGPLSVRQIGELLSKDRDDRTPFLLVRAHQNVDRADLDRVVQQLKDELRRKGVDPEISMIVRKEAPAPPSRPSLPRE